ncbi:histidine--tRNA ligase [Flagellimonas lutaonensis]|uniref:histidine--tRNA ligase n=1 Tax=Flagellimonas lutaonensis TaxID=516051 RepID=UPI0005F7B489|nr:histidine--tRNA ligase [Allomuricauda lutaonensis]
MPQKPSIPKGTRDFSPTEVSKRNYIIDTIKRLFETFGFQPIETPSFENSETLLGKYGDEGDRLIFKILNSGDFISKVDDVTYSSKNSSTLAPKITEKALRYDLTVPFARYVVMHQNEIDFPFKRYQIQPVWRADRPQKGRFREFYQCDADVVGAYSLLQEVELVQLYDTVFDALGLHGVTIKLNNRKLLSAIAEVIGAQQFLVDFTVALDKLDKIGEEGVKKEMLAKGISEEAIQKAAPLFSLSGKNTERLDVLKDFLRDSEVGVQGVGELEFILNAVADLQLKASNIQLDVTLARGLNYYTGAIFEVAAPEGVQMGSIGGGGRYDDLTGIFGLKDVSGVGISFGLDRIYLVLEELGLFPDSLVTSLDVLCLNFGDKEALTALKLVSTLRRAGLRADLYPTSTKLPKQFKYADKRKVPYVVLLGEKELSEGHFVVKNMHTGEQTTYDLSQPDNFVNEVKG